jgi:UDP-2,3-diacylglucosamine pyrophosphatase LpxH
VSYLRHLVKLERELQDFLAYYTANHIDGVPWRLVVNGDMVDFMSVKIMPEAETGASAPQREDEETEDRLYGLGFGERQSQKKLEQVIVRHKGVFGRLAEFVAAGNDLVIVVGNHDVEFHFECVQRTFVEWLCALSLGAGAPDDARQAFAGRIQFCPWFYYREGLIYIEHGHQYDEYCSFDYLLHPVAKAQGGQKSGIALSMAHAGMRYFANQLPEYDPHTAEHWGLVNYVRWLWAQGLKGGIRVCYLYGFLIWKVVEMWYSVGRADAERRTVHLERLRSLSRHFHIAEEKLVALDALRRLPVIRRFFGVIATLFIDRIFLGIAATGLATFLGLHLRGPWRLVGPLATVVAAALVNELLNRLRLETCAAKLREAPQLIQRLVCAPLIVFGHSHAPEVIALDGGATYINTGTWASEDTKHAFTHLLVTRQKDAEAAPRAELRQWRDGSSAPYRK